MIKFKKSTKLTKDAVEVKSADQLKAELKTMQKDLVEFKRGHKLGELTNPRIITVTRKQIARLQTAILAVQIAPIASVVQRTTIKENK